MLRQGSGSGGRAHHWCAHCHRLDHFEVVAPTTQGIGERAGQRVEGMGAEEYLWESIVDPEAFLVEGFNRQPMPTIYGEILTEEDDLYPVVHSLFVLLEQSDDVIGFPVVELFDI